MSRPTASSLVWFCTLFVCGCFLVAAFSGCESSGPEPNRVVSETDSLGQTQTAVQSSPGHPVTEQETARTTETKWGGLSVVQSGEDLGDADQVVVFLHGLGGSGREIQPITRHLQTAAKATFVFPDGPLPTRNGGRAWMLKREDFEVSRAKVYSLLKYIRKENQNVQIILGGYSQGAIISSNLISETPQLLDAVILLSPSGQTIYEPGQDAENKPIIFLAHGKNDRTLPFDGSKELHEKLVDRGYDVDWFPYEGGHAIVPALPPRVKKFMERATKNDTANAK